MTTHRQTQGVVPKVPAIEPKEFTIINIINHLLVIGLFIMVLSACFNSSTTDSTAYRSRAVLTIRAGL